MSSEKELSSDTFYNIHEPENIMTSEIIQSQKILYGSNYMNNLF